MDDRERLRSTIAGAVGAVRRGDDNDALVQFGRLAGASGLTVRDSVWELAGANVEMLLTLTGHVDDGDLLVTLCSEDADGDYVPIDEFEPPQRATARILLALANGHPGDARTQLDIVADAPDPGATGEVFACTLAWTLELLDLCEGSGRPVPPWLEPVLAGQSDQFGH